MFKVVFFVVTVFLLVNYSIGYKWISIASDEILLYNPFTFRKIPKNDYYDRREVITYVGRARHHNEVLLAEANNTIALVQSCGTQISKYHFELLVGENCRWVNIMSLKEVPTDIVRGGTRADGEPIFVGRQNYRNKELMHIQHISLEEPELLLNPETQVLRCDDDNTWVDTAAGNMPNNTVAGGKSADGNPIFVARLKSSSCTTVPGQITPDTGFATAAYKNEDIQSPFCQVLVGEMDQYEWIPTQDGNIPDYAVVGGKDKNGQLLYVSRMNNTLGYIKHSTAAEMRIVYEVLVQNF